MLRYSIPQGVTLKADAKADEHGIGIGGWLSVEAQPSRGSAYWFAYQLKIEEFPKEWELPPEPQRAIACFETLAQTYLLLMARHLVCNASLPISLSLGPAALPLESDNTPTVGATNKLFTNKWPLAYFVINFAYWSRMCDIQAEVTHVPGAQNDWADELSRQGFTLLLQKGWGPSTQFKMSLQEVLLPKRGQFFPKDCLDRVPRRVGRFQLWLEVLGGPAPTRRSGGC